MTGDDILNLAGALYARELSPSEALCRNIVGRSYYGAFHLALKFFENLGLQISADHKLPVHYLIESMEPNAKRAGQLLGALHEARNRADYKLEHPKAIQESRDLQFIKAQVELANEIKSLLNLAAAEPARSAVVAGVQAFLQRRARTPRPQ